MEDESLWHSRGNFSGYSINASTINNMFEVVVKVENITIKHNMPQYDQHIRPSTHKCMLVPSIATTNS